MVSNDSSRPKSYVIRQAISQYIKDYREAQKRLRSKNKSFVSLDDMKERLGV